MWANTGPRVHKENVDFDFFLSSAAPADFIGFFIFAEVNSLSVSTLFQFTHRPLGLKPQPREKKQAFIQMLSGNILCKSTS